MVSAAEKLKALDAKFREPLGDVSSTRRRQKHLRTSNTVMDALPQIVAVVEAAEDFATWPDHQSPDWPALISALAALDEALS